VEGLLTGAVGADKSGSVVDVSDCAAGDLTAEEEEAPAGEEDTCSSLAAWPVWYGDDDADVAAAGEAATSTLTGAAGACLFLTTTCFDSDTLTGSGAAD